MSIYFIKNGKVLFRVSKASYQTNTHPHTHTHTHTVPVVKYTKDSFLDHLGASDGY